MELGHLLRVVLYLREPNRGHLLCKEENILLGIAPYRYQAKLIQIQI